MELVLFIYLLVFEKAVVRLSDCVARTNFSQAAGTEPLKAGSALQNQWVLVPTTV